MALITAALWSIHTQFGNVGCRRRPVDYKPAASQTHGAKEKQLGLGNLSSEKVGEGEISNIRAEYEQGDKKRGHSDRTK